MLAGDFAVQREGTNHFLELPGAPLDSFAAQFGPGGKDKMVVSARVWGTKKGRRTPTFGVGLGGVSGWKLQVAPAKDALELLQDQSVQASANYEWKSGTWTQLRLQILPGHGDEWKIVGKAWAADEDEAKATLVSVSTKIEPVTGRPSIIGSPFSGTPIRYDELRVERVTAK